MTHTPDSPSANPNKTPAKAVTYRIPDYIAFVHSEELSEHSAICTYLADVRSGQVSVLEGSASIIWGVFEEPFTAEEALEVIAGLTEQDPEHIRTDVEEFIRQLHHDELLETLAHTPAA